MKYNSSSKSGTPSDSPSRLASVGSETGEIGGGADNYLKDYTSKWGSSGEVGGSMSNPGTGNFNINKRANMAKGNFAIPSVNSMVWVVFINGDPQFPIVMGAAPAVLDFQQNISPSGYPGAYENKGSVPGRSTSDELIYRNVSIQNSGGVTREVSNNPANPYVTEVHPSGSSHTIDAGGSKNSLTMGDVNNVNAANTYNDTRGSTNDYIEGKKTTISKGDIVVRTGSLNYAAANQEAFIQESIDEQ
jgi:hypothetical protein